MGNQIADIGIILRSYGLVHFDRTFDSNVCRPEEVVFWHPGLDIQVPASLRVYPETERQAYYPYRKYSFSRILWKRKPVYHALVPHVSFAGRGLKPLWINQEGRAVLAWHEFSQRKRLLIGLDVLNETVRHRQGDPRQVDNTPSHERECWGFSGERPLYLFRDHILPEYATQPWVDHLGFFLAETLSRMSGYPLVEPLPAGARGAIILTGDDDQAFLDKYEEQLRVIGKMPITYFLHHRTRHNSETIQHLPPNVELGLHPDALDAPEQYEKLCVEQSETICCLAGRPMRLVRNHGYLNRDYLGHLPCWEQTGLKLDVNYPGLDGTALNGSFLPMRLRRPDGQWSEHYSLLTGFGDGMLPILGFNSEEGVKRIRRVARQIENSHPGVLVFNFHPQNITETRDLHEAVLVISRRPGWVALGLETYLNWLETLESLKLEPLGGGRYKLTAPGKVQGLVLRQPIQGGWRRHVLEPWCEEIEIHLSS